MRISELAKSAGVGVETVRFYQRKGLLSEPERGDGMRRYSAEDAGRLRAIRQAQAAGFTLAQIAELIELDSRDDRQRARELARERIAALDAQIGALEAARRTLVRLARDCKAGGEGPCPILAAFEPAPSEPTVSSRRR